jgi:spermidine synthase
MPEITMDDTFIRHEMLTHPALFTHQKTHTVAIMSTQDDNVANEVLKHAMVKTVLQVTAGLPQKTEYDDRLTYFIGDENDWLNQIESASVDMIILPQETQAVTPNLYRAYFNALRDNGILVQQGESFFVPGYFNALYATLNTAGFYEVQVLHFPQPSAAAGLRSAIMAVKNGCFKWISENTIFNKPFTTRYYNFDVHKAALVMPEFIRKELVV